MDKRRHANLMQGSWLRRRIDFILVLIQHLIHLGLSIILTISAMGSTAAITTIIYTIYNWLVLHSTITLLHCIYTVFIDLLVSTLTAYSRYHSIIVHLSMLVYGWSNMQQLLKVITRLSALSWTLVIGDWCFHALSRSFGYALYTSLQSRLTHPIIHDTKMMIRFKVFLRDMYARQFI